MVSLSGIFSMLRCVCYCRCEVQLNITVPLKDELFKILVFATTLYTLTYLPLTNVSCQ